MPVNQGPAGPFRPPDGRSGRRRRALRDLTARWRHCGVTIARCGRCPYDRSVTTQPSAISAAELTVWRTMLRAQVQISRRLQADLLADHDLALGSYDVLMHLGETPGGRLRMNDLADRVLLSRSGLTRLVDRLQREGLVVRQSCASDARGLYAVLTPMRPRPPGRRHPHLPAGRAGVRAGKLDDEDLRQFGHILDKLADEPGRPVSARAEEPARAEPARAGEPARTVPA